MADSPQNQSAAGTDGLARRWSIIVTVLLLLVLCYWLRYVLMPFAVAGGLAFVAGPVVRRLARRMPHALAATMVFVVFVAIVAALFYWMQSVVVPETIDFMARLPEILSGLLAEISHGQPVHLLGRDMDATQLSQQIVDGAGNWLASPRTTFEVIGTGFGSLMALILTLVLMCYFLLSGRRLAMDMLWLVPPAFRPQVQAIATRVRPILRRYIIGLIVIVIYAFLLTWVATGFLFHLRHAVLLSLATGFLELIPVVGPATSIILISAVAVERGSLAMIIGFAIFIIALRLTIDQLVGPLVLGRAVTLHPVVIIFAFLAGGTLFGILGVLVAIPAAATIKLALEECYGEAVREKNAV